MVSCNGATCAAADPISASDAYDAPFPDVSFRAATRAFPEIVPDTPEADGVAVSREAARFWAEAWSGRTMMAVGTQDPVFSPAVMEALRQKIRNCPPAMLIAEAGHFVQEHGERIAAEALGPLGVGPRTTSDS